MATARQVRRTIASALAPTISELRQSQSSLEERRKNIESQRKQIEQQREIIEGTAGRQFKGRAGLIQKQNILGQLEQSRGGLLEQLGKISQAQKQLSQFERQKIPQLEKQLQRQIERSEARQSQILGGIESERILKDISKKGEKSIFVRQAIKNIEKDLGQSLPDSARKELASQLVGDTLSTLDPSQFQSRASIQQLSFDTSGLQTLDPSQFQSRLPERAFGVVPTREEIQARVSQLPTRQDILSAPSEIGQRVADVERRARQDVIASSGFLPPIEQRIQTPFGEIVSVQERTGVRDNPFFRNVLFEEGSFTRGRIDSLAQIPQRTEEVVSEELRRLGFPDIPIQLTGVPVARKETFIGEQPTFGIFRDRPVLTAGGIPERATAIPAALQNQIITPESTAFFGAKQIGQAAAFGIFSVPVVGQAIIPAATISSLKQAQELEVPTLQETLEDSRIESGLSREEFDSFLTTKEGKDFVKSAEDYVDSISEQKKALLISAAVGGGITAIGAGIGARAFLKKPVVLGFQAGETRFISPFKTAEIVSPTGRTVQTAQFNVLGLETPSFVRVATRGELIKRGIQESFLAADARAALRELSPPGQLFQIGSTKLRQFGSNNLLIKDGQIIGYLDKEAGILKIGQPGFTLSQTTTENIFGATDIGLIQGGLRGKESITINSLKDLNKLGVEGRRLAENLIRENPAILRKGLKIETGDVITQDFARILKKGKKVRDLSREEIARSFRRGELIAVGDEIVTTQGRFPISQFQKEFPELVPLLKRIPRTKGTPVVTETAELREFISAQDVTFPAIRTRRQTPITILGTGKRIRVEFLPEETAGAFGIAGRTGGRTGRKSLISQQKVDLLADFQAGGALKLQSQIQKSQAAAKKAVRKTVTQEAQRQARQAGLSLSGLTGAGGVAVQSFDQAVFPQTNVLRLTAPRPFPSQQDTQITQLGLQSEVPSIFTLGGQLQPQLQPQPQQVSLITPELQIPRPAVLDIARDILREETKVQPREITREVTREIPREIARDIARDITRQPVREDTREILREVTRQIPRQVTRPVLRTPTRQRPPRTPPKTPPKVPPVIITPQGLLNEFRKKYGKKPKSFDVLIKRKGKFQKIGDDLPVGLALKTGTEASLNSLAAQFKLRPEFNKKPKKKDIKFKPPVNSFRNFQIKSGQKIQLEPGHFIERKTERITSGGEIKEILKIQSQARKARGGRRSKKGNAFKM